jgi:predicted transcriptional regulator
MKTIKNIADELGVSKQAVFYRIRKEPLSKDLQSLMSKTNGVLTVSVDGETLIKKAFNDNSAKMFDDKKASNENGIFDGEIIKILEKNIETLQKQLEVKDKQIEELTETIKIQAESINADRKNELAETILEGQKQLTDSNDKPFWRFWQKRENTR